jgi:predicted dehydrogenase
MAVLFSRRRFLKQAAVAGTAAAALGSLPAGAPAGPRSPSDKLHIACIGVGGRGRVNLNAMAEENVVAICDVDEGSLGNAAQQFPKAKRYLDFRKLLQEERRLDGVVISTPDHCHAPATMMAMNLGWNVYCEKPLTHSVYEARRITEAAARTKVVTQMGTNSQAAAGYLPTVELVEAGAIGEVREVHVWTNRPVWPQGQDRLPGEDPVPAALNWDLWIGPAPLRPYKEKYLDGPFAGKKVYHPFVWRGWWDFGTGALGDMAAHLMNVAFRALRLGAPASVEAESSGMKPEAFPSGSVIRFRFPATQQRPAVTLVWYDGGKRPPAELLEGEPPGDNGSLFVGTKGKIYSGERRNREAEPILLPAKTFADYQRPKPTRPRFAEVHDDWLRAIREGTPTACGFGYAGPMTEAFLLGNIALRVGQQIQWDPAALRVTNCPEANQFLKYEYRKGWKL